MLRVSKCRNFVTSIFICYIIQRKKWGLISFFFPPCEINKNELNFILRFETCPNPNQLYTTSFHFFFPFLYYFIFKQKKEVEEKKKQPPHSTWTVFFLLCYFSHFLLLLLLFIIYFIFKTPTLILHIFFQLYIMSIFCLEGFFVFQMDWVVSGEGWGADMCIE